jgi:hypothetical protein
MEETGASDVCFRPGSRNNLSAFDPRLPMTLARSTVAAFLALAAAGALHAQEKQRPKSFLVRWDEPGPDTTKTSFVTMSPGWHFTTGPNAGIFYDPAWTATGNYKAEALIHLFDPPKGHAEAYGIFVGGKDLKGASESYLYFLLRTDGQYLIKQRSGTKVTEIAPPTASPAVKPFDAAAKSAANTITIAAGPETVDFLINGTKVASRPRKELAVDGTAGLRINHMLNVHVEKFAITK